MNKYEKEVEKQLLDNEKQMLKELEETYTKALASIKKRISELQGKSDELTQSKVYQIDFQRHLEKQVTSILELLKNDINSNTNTYLAKMYEDGYIGTSYDFSKAYGIDNVLPIDQKAVLDTINKKVDDMTFAERTDVNMKEFKTSVKSEISRGFATSRTYAEIAQSISLVAESQMYKAYRIARTEGLRCASQSKLNYAKSVKEKYGADLVKKWDSTLDGKTRPEHQQLDGQIKELDEDFECSGGKAQAPGMFGNPAMDCSCRCCLLQIPRWAVDVSMTKIDNANSFKENGEVNLIETQNYNEYKKKYFKYFEKDGILKASNSSNNLYSSKITQLEILEDISSLNKTNTLKKYEKDIVNETVENAIVINKEGIVYKLESNSANSVYIKNLGENNLKDAYMTHNHPKLETYYSFSAFDISEFMETGMEKLRGVDYKYVYEIEKDENMIKVNRDEILHSFSTNLRNEALEIIRMNNLDADEEEYHIINKLLAEKYKYKYRRIKNE